MCIGVKCIAGNESGMHKPQAQPERLLHTTEYPLNVPCLCIIILYMICILAIDAVA